MNTLSLKRGFTVIEIIFVVTILAAASIIFFIQRDNLAVSARDEQRKTAINAMYYSLEEVYFKANSSYPRSIDETVLPSVDPALFTDPNGHKIGTSDSSYRYETFDCNETQCKRYTLRTTLENEADFIKDSKNK